MTDWASARLDGTHDLAAFDSGRPVLDAWLRDHARRAQQQGTAVTHVWAGPDSVVVAYFSMAPTQVTRETVTSSQAGGLSVVPAYLIARLALDRSLHGRGLGAQLLRDALERIVAAADQVGGRLIVVDALDESAASFYGRFDFRPARPASGEPEYPRRMVMKVATARSTLGL